MPVGSAAGVGAAGAGGGAREGDGADGWDEDGAEDAGEETGSAAVAIWAYADAVSCSQSRDKLLGGCHPDAQHTPPRRTMNIAAGRDGVTSGLASLAVLWLVGIKSSGAKVPHRLFKVRFTLPMRPALLQPPTALSR